MIAMTVKGDCMIDEHERRPSSVLVKLVFVLVCGLSGLVVGQVFADPQKKCCGMANHQCDQCYLVGGTNPARYVKPNVATYICAVINDTAYSCSDHMNTVCVNAVLFMYSNSTCTNITTETVQYTKSVTMCTVPPDNACPPPP